MSELSQSYAKCQSLARQSASNFTWVFWLLPRRKRKAMYALYAFLRRTDDLGDNSSPAADRLAALDQWRNSFEQALSGKFDDPLLPAVVDSIRVFAIPPKHLFAAIEGVAMDCVALEANAPRFQTFAELEHYCELVASAVGMACIHIWGFRDEAAFEPARQCGIAFQLTNILRDLRPDVEQGRIYLPREDLDRAGYTPPDLRQGTCDDRFAALMRQQIARAKEFYRSAEGLEQFLDPAGRRIFGAMMTTYRGLLAKIEAQPASVLDSRVRLSRWQKFQIAGRWLILPPRMTDRSAASTSRGSR